MKIFSEAVVLCWNIAGAEALSAHFRYVMNEHILIALTEMDKLLSLTADKLNLSQEEIERAKKEYDVLAKIFLHSGIDPVSLRRRIRTALGKGNFTTARGDIHRNSECRAAFERARKMSPAGKPANCFALMLAVFEKPSPLIEEIFADLEISTELLRETIVSFAQDITANAGKARRYVTPDGLDMVLAIGRDISLSASGDRVSFSVGRKAQRERIAQVLAKDGRKKNLLLTGDAGVGKKTAVHTAARDAWRVAPEGFENKVFIEILLDRLISSHDGKNSLNAFADAMGQARGRKDLILVFENFDGFFTIQGEYGREIAEILRNEIMSGAVQAIGTAAPKDKDKILQEFPQIEKYFEELFFSETDKEETLEILKDCRVKLEFRYGVKISPSAIRASYILAKKFAIPGAFPQKTIKILEKACIKARVPIGELSDTLLKRMSYSAKKFNLDMSPDVHEGWIALAVSEILETSVMSVAGHIDFKMPARLAKMEDALKETVIGQNSAIEETARAVKSAFLSEDYTRKLPVLLVFTGPKAVGKTELARKMAKHIYGSESEVVYFDMAQFSTPSRVQRLFGLDGKNGIIQQVLCENPFQEILFENTENTVPLFYRELENLARGKSRGMAPAKMPNLSRTIFALTTSMFHKTAAESAPAKEINKKINSFLPASFMEIASKTVIFNPMTEPALTRIIENWIDNARAKVKDRFNVRINIGREAEKALVQKGVDAGHGVRKMRVVFDELFSSPLQAYIDNGMIKKHKEWLFSFSGGKGEFVPK